MIVLPESVIFWRWVNLAIFLIILILFICYWAAWNPAKLINVYSGTGIILAVILCFFLFGMELIPNFGKPGENNVWINSALMSLSFTVSAIFLLTILYTLGAFSHTQSIYSSILEFVIIAIFFAIAYKIVPVTITNLPDSVQLFINIILYIPCLFSTTSDNIVKTAQGDKTVLTTKYQSPSKSVWLLFGIEMVLIGYWYGNRYIYDAINKQPGEKILINRPIELNEEQIIATYDDLFGVPKGNETMHPNYRYCISLWVYIDALPPNTNIAYLKDTTIFNYGGTPNITFNVKTNVLKIFANNPSIEVFSTKSLKLQKWNHIAINNSGGLLDIFLNGMLVASAGDISPIDTFPAMTVGSNNGISGKITNVSWFKTPQTQKVIENLYNSYGSRLRTEFKQNYPSKSLF